MLRELTRQIRDFVEPNFLVPTTLGLKDSDSLVDLQIVDSTGFLELIQFVESELGVVVAEPEMVLENFETIERIEQFVIHKRGTASAAGV